MKTTGAFKYCSPWPKLKTKIGVKTAPTTTHTNFLTCYRHIRTLKFGMQHKDNTNKQCLKKIEQLKSVPNCRTFLKKNSLYVLSLCCIPNFNVLICLEHVKQFVFRIHNFLKVISFIFSSKMEKFYAKSHFITDFKVFVLYIWCLYIQWKISLCTKSPEYVNEKCSVNINCKNKIRWKIEVFVGLYNLTRLFAFTADPLRKYLTASQNSTILPWQG